MVTIPVLQKDVNPYPTSEPLKVINPVNATGASSGMATLAGSTAVAFTASSTFSGTVTVTYTLVDNSGLAGRYVQGTVTITVYGKPGQPGAPTVDGYGSGTVLLSWNAPSDNGRPIDNYVLSDGTTSQSCGSATTCTFTGLHNTTSYQFTVFAHNVVNNGPPSQPSAQVTPDVVPGAPDPPTTAFHSGAITVTWTPPAIDSGSSIRCYLVVISPPTGTAPGCVSALTYPWSGLTNGDSYTFAVCAMNKQGCGPYSAPSAPQIPAGVPNPPGQPSAAAVTNDPTGGKLNVTWPSVTDAADNGDTVSLYTVNIYQNGVLFASPPWPPTSEAETQTDPLTGLTNKDSYTFTVTATNKAGTSQPSPPSLATTVFGAPGTVSDLNAASNQSGQTTLSFTPPDSNGQNISSYNYTEDGGAIHVLLANHVVTGLTNGQAYTFQIQACNTYCGAWSNTVSATPDAAPAAPTPSGSFSNPTFTFSWGPATSNGCPIASLGWSNGNPNGPWNGSPLGGDTVQIAGGYNQTVTVYVHAQDSCGLSSTASGSYGPVPPPTSVTVTEGNAATVICGACHWVDWTATGFAPNTAYNWSCSDNGGQFWGPGSSGYAALTTDGSGAITDNPPASATAPEDCAEGFNGRTVTVTFGGVPSPGYVWP
jgi:hypothetical protein